MTAPRLRLERPSTRFSARLAVDAPPPDGEPGDISRLTGPGDSGDSLAHRRLETPEPA